MEASVKIGVVERDGHGTYWVVLEPGIGRTKSMNGNRRIPFSYGEEKELDAILGLGNRRNDAASNGANS